MQDMISASQALGPQRALPQEIFGLAVFIDIDGTLLDIAPTPETVIVPPGLPQALGRLSARLDGALALVTGRPIETVDRLLKVDGVAVCGLHGAEQRDAAGRITRPETTAPFERARILLRDRLALLPGTVFEDKGAAIAAHYRLAPEREVELRDLMQRLAGEVAEGWVLQEGKQVFELRPNGRDKGAALKNFMAMPPFYTRRPLAIGDDLTDEAMFAAANDLGGLSFRVSDDGRPSLAHGCIAAPAELRAWIAKVSA
jgi:trehalose 6-phosphate phosphatase